MKSNFSKLNDWDDLRYFLAVVRGGGLTQAAGNLGVSPATVSRRIDAIELALGMKLFIRRQTGYSLTEDGEHMKEHALPVEEAMYAFSRRTQVGAGHNQWSGKISVACSEFVAAHWIVPRLGEFFKEYPGLQVELHTRHELLDLSRREADMAVRFVPPSASEEGDFIAHKLTEIEFSAYRAVTLETEHDDWQQLPYIAWPEQYAHLPMSKWITAVFPHRMPVMSSNNLILQHIAAQHGYGTVVLPTLIGDSDPRLMRVTSDLRVASRQLWLVFHRDLRDSERLIAMRHFLTAIFATVA